MSDRHHFADTPPSGFAAEQRLAVYGSLAPGEANAHILGPLAGSWCDGIVRGTLHDAGWAAALGHRAIRLDPNAAEVPVKLFSSADLPDFWRELDAFEGADYERVVAPVQVGDRMVEACIYCQRKRP